MKDQPKPSLKMPFFTSKFRGRSIPPRFPGVTPTLEESYASKIPPSIPHSPRGQMIPMILSTKATGNTLGDPKPQPPATKPFELHRSLQKARSVSDGTPDVGKCPSTRSMSKPWVSGGNNNNNNKLHASQRCAMVEITLDSPNFTKPTAPTWSYRGITRQWSHLL